MNDLEPTVVKSFERVFPTPVVVEDWEGVLGRTGVERQPPRRIRWRVVAIAAFVVLAGLLVVPGFSLGNRLLDLVRDSSPCPDLVSPTWSPDGRKIAFAREFAECDKGEIYIVNADGSGLKKLTRNAANDASAAWSPDGRRIAFMRQRTEESERLRAGCCAVYVMNADGSRQRSLAPDLVGVAPSWSPDGRKIGFTSAYGIYVVNADGSGLRNLTPNRGGTGSGSWVWSPDGRKIVFSRAPRLSQSPKVTNRAELYVMNADGSGQRRLTRDVGAAYGFAWSPDGGKIAFLRDGEIYVMNVDGSGQRNLTLNTAEAYVPVWSPDGRKIAFASESDDNDEITVMNADGSGKRNLTRSPADDYDPAWSPDGRKITFVSDRTGKFEIYVMNADGGGVRKLTAIHKRRGS